MAREASGGPVEPPRSLGAPAPARPSQGQAYPRYAALWRRLDAVRAAESDRVSRRQTWEASTRVQLDELEERQRAQAHDLTEGSRYFGFRVPELAAVVAEDGADASACITRATAEFDAARRALDQAYERARQPAFMPGFPAFVRNVVVYGLAAHAMVVAEVAYMLRLESVDDLPWWRMLFVFPALAFVLGLVLVVLANRVRALPTAQGHGRPPRPPRVTLSLRTGMLLCALIGPESIFFWYPVAYELLGP